MSDKRKQVPKWIAPLLRRHVDYLQETSRILSLSVMGIRRLQGEYDLERLRVEVREALSDSDAIEASKSAESLAETNPPQQERLERAKEIADLATNEANHDFPILHGHSVVAAWGVLDALVDDLLVEILVNQPGALRAEAFTRVRVYVGTYEALDGPDKMRFLLDALKQQKESRYKPGVAGYEELLDVFGLSGPIEENIRRTLVEMREVRNVLVHNAGVVDRRLLNRCPWVSWEMGSRLSISQAKYLEYAEAVDKYLVGLIDRIRAHYGITRPQAVGEDGSTLSRE